MVKTCCKAYICQGASCQGVVGCPRVLPGKTSPARSHHPSQKQGSMGDTEGSWGRHICPLFTVGTSRGHGWAQATELPSVHGLAAVEQFCNSYLPNASPQPGTIGIAVLNSPGPFFPCCALAHFCAKQRKLNTAFLN